MNLNQSVCLVSQGRVFMQRNVLLPSVGYLKGVPLGDGWCLIDRCSSSHRKRERRTNRTLSSFYYVYYVVPLFLPKHPGWVNPYNQHQPHKHFLDAFDWTNECFHSLSCPQYLLEDFKTDQHGGSLHYFLFHLENSFVIPKTFEARKKLCCVWPLSVVLLVINFSFHGVIKQVSL